MINAAVYVRDYSKLWKPTLAFEVIRSTAGMSMESVGETVMQRAVMKR